MRRLGSVYHFAESIVNDLFAVSGLDFDEHYKTFCRNGLAAIEKDLDLLKSCILSEVRDKLNGQIREMRPVRIRDRNVDLFYKESYCNGFNDCRAEHNAIMSEINDIILYAVQLAMDRINLYESEVTS